MTDARSGSSWTARDLQFHNITITPIWGFRDFFGVDPLEVVLPRSVARFCELAIDSTNIQPTYAAIDEETEPDLMRVVSHLHDATRISVNAESSVDDFAVKLLEMCGYDFGGRIVSTRPKIRLLVSGESKYAKPDVYVRTKTDNIVLLVQEDKSWITGETKYFDSEAQVVAEAIAAYQHNRAKDERAQRAPVVQQRIPCIVMLGTYPMFYLITVTEMLSHSVALGIPSPVATHVHKYSIPYEGASIGDTLYYQEKRRQIMRAYIAFKRFL